jgi:hypothetical protein
VSDTRTSTTARQALGFAFRIESSDADLVELMEWCYRDLPDARDEPAVLSADWLDDLGAYHVGLTWPDGTIEVSEDRVGDDGVVEVLSWEVNYRSSQSRRHWPILHATVVGGPAGAVALCGASHSGKSTLAAQAARRGWCHSSDDLAPIETSTGLVHPYARPLMLRPGGQELLGELPALTPPQRRFLVQDFFCPASALGATAERQARPLVGVAVLSWTAEPTWTPLRRAELLYELTINDTTLADRGAEGFRQLEAIATAVPGHRLGVGAAWSALDSLAASLGW